MSPLLKDSSHRDRGTPSGTEPRQPHEMPASAELTKDAIFDILRASRRRGVLHYLQGPEDEASIGTLAEHIAAVENDIEPEALSSAQRKRVYIALYQCHLPKMADYGVIEYNDRGIVRLHPSSRLLLPYLYIDPERQQFSQTDASGLVARLRAKFGALLGRRR